MKIFLDMDGVLSDLTSKALELFRVEEGTESFLRRWRKEHPGDYQLSARIHEAMPEKKRPETLSDDDFWDQINQRGFDFWFRMPRYKWTLDLWRGCRAIAGDQVFVASAPTRGNDSPGGKAAWLREVFSIGPNRYMLGARKDLFAAPDRVLVDDNDENVEAFRKAGGHAILFPGPWNSNHERIGVELAWTMAELGRIGAEIAANKK